MADIATALMAVSSLISAGGTIYTQSTALRTAVKPAITATAVAGCVAAAGCATGGPAAPAAATSTAPIAATSPIQAQAPAPAATTAPAPTTGTVGASTGFNPNSTVPNTSGKPTAGTAQSAANPQWGQIEVQIVSNYRTSLGLHNNSWDDRLYQLALQHSQDQANRHSMDHNGFQTRFQQAQGYGYTTCVENVAYNYNDPQNAFMAWHNSPEHEANFKNANVKAAGSAIISGYSTWLACG